MCESESRPVSLVASLAQVVLVKITSQRSINMVEVVMAFQADALSMLEYGLTGLRILSENGMLESRDAQARVLIAGLIHTGKFLDVAEEMASELVKRTQDANDETLLERLREVRRGGPKPW